MDIHSELVESDLTPVDVANQLRDESRFVWLDSGVETDLAGEFDILAIEPSGILVAEPKRAVFTYLNQQTEYTDLWAALDCLAVVSVQGIDSLPFSGGLIGYIGYGYGHEFVRQDVQLGCPEAWFGRYNVALIFNRKSRAWYVVCPSTATDAERATKHKLLAALANDSHLISKRPPELKLSGLSPIETQARYIDSIKNIHDYLRNGDCYQVNYTQRWQAQTTSSAIDIYFQLRAENAGPYSAYLDIGGSQVVTISPEQFISIEGDRIVSKPIKGTRPRDSHNIVLDNQLKVALQTSEKDKSENLMIVDLLRNDIGQVAEAGSVTVESLFNVESYAYVHHLVSVIAGIRKAGETIGSVLAACMPGGSITGAPKRRAMEIIEELESSSRGPYCGSIGYVSYGDRAEFNIAIRTGVVNEDAFCFWAGGGIVSDSVAQDEYQESQTKAQAYLRLFESATTN